MLAKLGAGFSLAGSYAEGIAQPTFFDLYGFFPGSFAGNPSLKPERSHGFEVSARFRRSHLTAALTGYRQRLKDEIVDLFDPSTFQSSTTNRIDSSRRSGVEAEFAWQPSPALRLSANYAFLDASEPAAIGGAQLREVRRPRHSGSVALDGTHGRLNYGASIAYTGARLDTNFDVFPALAVRLGSYWLAGARIAYRVTDRSSCLHARPMRSTNATRTCSAIARKGGAFMPASALLRPLARFGRSPSTSARTNICCCWRARGNCRGQLSFARPQRIPSLEDGSNASGESRIDRAGDRAGSDGHPDDGWRRTCKCPDRSSPRAPHGQPEAGATPSDVALNFKAVAAAIGHPERAIPWLRRLEQLRRTAPSLARSTRSGCPAAG